MVAMLPFVGFRRGQLLSCAWRAGVRVAWIAIPLLSVSPIAMDAQRSDGGSGMPIAASNGAPITEWPLRRESYNSPAGVVEVFGLRRWSLDALRDSVRAYQPGLDLHSAACQVVLRERFGFADALVRIEEFPTAGGRIERRFILKLVESGDSLRTRWNVRPSPPRDTFSVLRPTYATLVLAATDSAGQLLMGRLLWPLQVATLAPAWRAKLLEEERPSARADVEGMMRFLQEHSSDADLRVAVGAVRRDGFYANRLAAAMVLTSFPRHRSAWYAAVTALRDPNEAVRGAVMLSLRTLTRSFSNARPSDGPQIDSIDWRPALAELRLLVGGTNVEASEDVFTALVQTKVSATLASPLLGGNAEWLLLHLTASDRSTRGAARALLVRLAGGRDLGDDPAAWARWISTLQGQGPSARGNVRQTGPGPEPRIPPP